MPAPKSKFKLVMFEMILVWNVKEKPFITQKLSFKAPPDLIRAAKHAQYLIDLMARAGGIAESKVKLVAVSAVGALQEFQQEHAPFLLKQAQELQKRALEIKNSAPSDKKSVLPLLKKKKANVVLDMQLEIKTHTSAKMPKAKLAAPLEAIYDARKAETKAKEIVARDAGRAKPKVGNKTSSKAAKTQKAKKR